MTARFGIRPCAAHEAVAAILAARYGVPCDEVAAAHPCVGTLRLAPHQAEGATRLAATLRQHGVAVLADEVGMGKTRTAIAAAAAITAAEDTLVIVPAAVAAHWRTNLRAAVAPDGATPRVMSHGQLSRGASVPVRPSLVVVDEAHAFRNPGTVRYRTLARLCRGARVLLVTATPVVNRLADLYFQLRLAVGDGAFRELGIADLRTLFRHAAERPRAPPAAFRVLVRGVVVCRRRAGLGAAERARLGFPRRAPTIPVRYALAPAFDAGALAGDVEALRLPWFAGPTGPDAAALVRLMLLKRLESSTAAFAASLDRLAAYNERAAAALRSGVLLPARAARGSVPEQLTLDALLGIATPAGLDRITLLRHADDDAIRLHTMRARLAATDCDPKLSRLAELLAARSGRKTIVFTAYRDTAVMLWRALRPRCRCALLHGSGGAIGGEAAARADVVARFAPLANGRPPPPAAERIDVLIATDALSEGINLQDAGMVVSYDLPWQPVRLRQRLGRIDRLGCPHAVVECRKFLPDPHLERRLRLLQRLARKRAAAALVTRAAAHRAPRCGAWLGGEDPLRALARRCVAGTDAEHGERIERAALDSLEVIAARAPLPGGTAAFAAVGAGVRQRFWRAEKPPDREPLRWRRCGEDAAAELMAAVVDSRTDSAAPDPDATCRAEAADAVDGLLRTVRRARRTRRDRTRRGRSDPSRPAPTDPTPAAQSDRLRARHRDRRADVLLERRADVMLARRIRTLLQRAAGPPPAALLRRADAALRACRDGFDAATEHDVRALLRGDPPLPLLLDRLAAVVAGRPATRAAPPADGAPAAERAVVDRRNRLRERRLVILLAPCRATPPAVAEPAVDAHRTR